MKRALVLLSASLTLIASPALAGGSDCPLHKRLEAQKTQSATIIKTAAITPQLTPSTVVSPTVASPSPRSVIAANSSSPQPQSLQAQSEGDVLIVKEAQSQYGSGTAQPVKAVSKHGVFTNILQKYVSAPDAQGLTHFSYGNLKANAADKAALDNYIKALEGVNPERLAPNAAIAYYANLYNAVTVQVVTDNYPLKSIRKLGSFNSGPWKKDLFTINGAPASLDKVEHGILRKQFPSPYIHYMVNCASVGCPNLLDTAWEAGSLEAERQKAASAYINSPRGVQITPKGLKISSIFKWFKEDFGGKSGVLKHIRQYARPELAQAIDNGAQIVDYGYDWSLNE